MFHSYEKNVLEGMIQKDNSNKTNWRLGFHFFGTRGDEPPAESGNLIHPTMILADANYSEILESQSPTKQTHTIFYDLIYVYVYSIYIYK